jgi:peptide/nickel transport system substrate-binding protein
MFGRSSPLPMALVLRRPTCRALPVVGLSLFLVAACAPATPAAPGAPAPPAAAGTTAPAPAATARVLVIDQPGDAATLDPGLQYDTTSYGVYRNIFDTLLGRDPKSGQIVPRLAKAWKMVDPTTWEFDLQDGVKFHNGDALTADDVKFSIDRMLDPSFKSPQYQNFSSIKDVTAVNPTTVRIVTSDPYPALLAQLVNLSIVPAAYTRAKGADALNVAPVGSGPYKFVEWRKGESVTLEADPSYWRGAPSIANVKFRAVPEPATRVADLQNGTADLLVGLDVDSIKQIESNARLRVLSVDTERVAYIAFDPLGKGPSAKKEVRQAIVQTIEPKVISDALLGGQVSPVATYLTSLHVGYDASIPAYPHDPDEAKALLAQAGYSNGVSLTFLTSPAYDQRIVQAIQGQLDPVGIKAEIQMVDQPTYLKKVQGPDHDWGDIRFGQWSCSCLDADGVIYPLFRTGSIWSSYTNPRFDADVDQARTSVDDAKRKQLYSEAARILQDDVVGEALWQVKALYGARASLTWQPTVDEQLLVFDMKDSS